MGRAHEVRKASMAKTAAVKSAVNGRAAKEIYMAAKNGSTDVNANLALRAAVEKAKSNHVPTDVINRAIKRAEGGDTESYAANRYEGYGPGNSLVIVDSLTSNVNRAIAEIRDAFNKNGGKIVQAGAISHQFEERATFIFNKGTAEEVLEALINADVDIIDVEEEDSTIFVFANYKSFNSVKKALEDFGVTEFEKSEIEIVPVEYATLEGETKDQFIKLIDKLDSLEDVQAVTHNIDLL